MDYKEEEFEGILHDLSKALPNSEIYGMMFFPDIKRTPEEIVDEAFRRAAAPKLALPPPTPE